MSDKLEQVVSACESLTQTFEQQASNINAALANQEKRIGDKEKEVDNFLADASPEPRIVNKINIGGSKDYLYPVWFKFPEHGGKFKVWRHYLWDANERPLNPLSTSQAGLHLEFEGAGAQWSGNPKFMHTKRFDSTYTELVSHTSFKMYCYNEKVDPNLPLYGGGDSGALGTYSSVCSGFYLRGGGVTYEFISNWKIALNYSDSHENAVIDEGKISDESGTYRWYVKPIPLSEIMQPEATLVPFDSFLALKA